MLQIKGRKRPSDSFSKFKVRRTAMVSEYGSRHFACLFCFLDVTEELFQIDQSLLC